MDRTNIIHEWGLSMFALLVLVASVFVGVWIGETAMDVLLPPSLPRPVLWGAGIVGVVIGGVVGLFTAIALGGLAESTVDTFRKWRGLKPIGQVLAARREEEVKAAHDREERDRISFRYWNEDEQRYQILASIRLQRQELEALHKKVSWLLLIAFAFVGLAVGVMLR